MILKEGINYSLIGHFDMRSIFSKIESNNLDWDLYDFRQKRFKDHSETKTIPIIWSEKFNSIETHEPYFTIFKEDIERIESLIRSSFCNTGKLMSAILINLPAGKSIGRHIDANPIGERFNRCHRIHIPITTNDECFFEIDGEYKNMKCGEIWEINNVRKKHSVSNRGKTDRIHLLLDWDPITE